MSSEHHQGSLAPGGTEAGAVLDDIRRSHTRQEVLPSHADDSGLLAAADREQLDRDIAAIERASAALRRAEPALESWAEPLPPTMQKPRSVWLLIGALWLSTALVALGAVFAISALVG